MEVITNKSFPIFLVIIVTLTITIEGRVTAFKEVKVGGIKGWKVPNDTSFYDHWASTKRLHVGDLLRFEYENDTLLVVDKYGYYHCDPAKAISTYNNGNTSIKLEHPGFIFFISGNVDNCHNGKRLQVDVMSPHYPHSVASSPEEGRGYQADAPAPGQSGVDKTSGSVIVRGSYVLGGLVAVVTSVLVA